MAKKEGLLIIFEGIDGAGTSTQVRELDRHIENELSKYEDVLRTHEPTWRAREIKERLKKDKNAFAGGLELANLYIEDRARHTHEIIRPVLKAGGMVNCDRYKMSTCAYQWTQGVPLEELIELHKHRGILMPDMTFYIHVRAEVAEKRLKKRGDPPEKFEKDPKFREKLVSAYRSLANHANVDPSFFGNVVFINGNQTVRKVAQEVQEHFDELYTTWSNGKYISQSARENS